MMNSVKINYAAVGITLMAVLLITMRMYYHSNLVVMGSVNLKELLSVSLELSEAGGVKVVEVKNVHNLNAESKGLTKEGAREMKTDGDMQSHRAIVAGFHNAFPVLDTRIVSEEHDKHPDNENTFNPSRTRPEVSNLPDQLVDVKDITIWIDPLDATQEYTEDLDQYVTVMICVAVKGKPVIGVIHRPTKSKNYVQETVWAWVGQGVSSNLGSIKANDAAEAPASPAVIISRSHSGSANLTVIKAFGKGKVIPAGGAGYKSIEVIRGKADVYAHVTLIKKWDICAGDALLRAVGGSMKTLKDESIDYDKSGSPANAHGLLASVNNFKYYMDKLGPVFADTGKK